MGWVWSFHCENESCVHALVHQEQEPIERNQASVLNFTLKWLSIKFLPQTICSLLNNLEI